MGQLSGKLKIGVSSCFFHADPKRAIFKGKTLVYTEQSLTHWIMSEDAVPFILPPPMAGGSVTFKDIVHEMDGLVLSGGSDVSPRSYGETPLKPEWSGDDIRDVYEQDLVREFMNQRKPVLGVCRGAQLLNVAFGGTLFQDIATQIPESINHRNWDIYDQNFQSVDIVPGTKLAEIYSGKKSAKINSIHHQAIKNLGKGLVVEARTPQDSVIEAIRLNDPKQYVAAIQWHPEFHDPKDHTLLDSAPLLKDYLNAVRQRREYA